MRDQFIIPQEPKLHWKTLLPRFRRNASFGLRDQRIVRLFLARNGIYHGLTALGVEPGENVLVPAYHCKALVEPILFYGSEVRFYEVNLDLTADFNDLRSKIDQNTRAILLIHYFGFPQALRRYRDLCDQAGVYLIEDCAHVLTGNTVEGATLGSVGDISIFSWRKFLPIYDGGELVVNNPRLALNVALDKGSFLFKLKVAKNTLEALSRDSQKRRGNALSSLWGYTSSALKRSPLVKAATENARQINAHQVDFDLSCVNLAMSAVSRHVMEQISIAEVCERRQRNYDLLGRMIFGIPGLTPLWVKLPDGVCPWIFPVFAPRTKNLSRRLREKGIPAAGWDGVIHPSLPLGSFPRASKLYDHLVFLPVHQSLEPRDLSTIITVLRETLGENVDVTAKGLDDCVPLPAV